MKYPNVLLIISDALRPKDISLYGRDKETDYFIKKIADESITCKLNFAASNGSDPSVTSLFSGQYPTTIGFIHQHPFMRKEEIEKLKKNKFWLPIFLQNKGYETISVTPLHLWFKKGFNYYTDKDNLKKGRFLDKPFIKRILLSLPNWMYSLGKKMVKMRASPEFYSSDSVIELAMEKIKNAKKPFFLFMHLVDTHYPYPIAPIKKTDGKNTLDEILKKVKYQKQKEYIKKRFYDLSAENMEQIERKRDDSIIAVDKNIGKLRDFLKKNKIWENTIFIILSDHGDNFGEHETYFCRGGLYEESVHVPLIMHIPGFGKKEINEITQTIDIAPTILDCIGEKKSKIDGKSILKIAKSGKPVRENAFFIDAFCDKRIALRSKEKKFIFSKNGECFLCGSPHCKSEKEEYDLLKDLEEENNIYSGKSKLENEIKLFD